LLISGGKIAVGPAISGVKLESFKCDGREMAD
jgi:hypothetical protein